jgi:GNAT superfamily N-acetyltransferase
MDSQTILHLYDLEMREDTPPGRVTIYRQPGLTFLTVPPPGPTAGFVVYTRLDPAAADQAIQSTIDFFRGYGGEFDWKVYEHDTPPDIKQRLLAHGFVPEEVEEVLALDLQTVPASFWDSSPVTVQKLTDPEQLGDVTRIEAGVWNESFASLEAMLSGEMQETADQISVYVAYAGGKPASCAWIRFYPERQFAELYGGATLRDQRGQGLYTALVKARAREARGRGVRFLVVDTSPMSGPVLKKLGFVLLTRVQRFILDVGR